MPYTQTNGRSHHKLIKKMVKQKELEALQDALKELDTVEIVDSLFQLKLKYQMIVFDLLGKKQASDVLSRLPHHSSILMDIVEQMEPAQLGALIEEMDRDDAVDVVSTLDEEKAGQVLDILPVEDRQEITSLLQYDEESAGGIMDPRVAVVRQQFSVEQAIRNIRAYSKKKDLDNFYTIYVVDVYNHLIGFVDLPQLVLAKRDQLISEIMNPDVIAVNVETDQEKVAQVAQEYDLVTVPVIDKHLRLVGRVTSDDLMDVIRDEFIEDMGHYAGTGDEDVLETSVVRASRDRMPWLLLGLGGGFLAAFVMRGYEESLASLPEAAYFIPLIAALGGNIAIQSSSLVVRGLATGELRSVDLFNRTWKELRVGFLNGAICAVIVTLMAWWLTSEFNMGLSAGVALFAVVCLAALVGTTVPMILKRMHLDPALATGPFITTTNDILGIMIYLSITFSVYSRYLT